MPPVCSNNVRRSLSSPTPKRSAMPGRYQTGSIAALVTATSPDARTISPSIVRSFFAINSLRSGSVSRALVIAMDRADIDAFRDLGAEVLGDAMAPGIERDDARRLRPLRERSDLDDRRRVGQVRPRDRIERAGGNRERAIKRIGAAMRADGVAVVACIDGADHGTAFARGRRAPADREAGGRAAARMRCDPDMAVSVRGHRIAPQKQKALSGEPGEWLQKGNIRASLLAARPIACGKKR